MMRHTILPALVAAATLVLLSGCHKSLSSDPAVDCVGQREQPVRITAEIAGYASAYGSPTRAAGELLPGEKEWNEKQIKANTEESAVYCAVLAAYKLGADDRPEDATKPTKLAFYHSPALMYAYRIAEEGKYTDESGNEQTDVKLSRELDELKQLNLGKERKEVRSFSSRGLDSQMLTMDLELEPGKYLFLLVANSWSATKQALAVMDGEPGATFDPTQILGPEDRTQPCTTLDLLPNFFLQIPHRMMPMLGQQIIEVPAEGGSVTPEITLERLYARLDITLTTASKDASGELHYLTSDRDGVPHTPQDYILTDLSFYNLGPYNYALLPQEGEFSALDRRVLQAANKPTVSAGNKDQEYIFGYTDQEAQRFSMDLTVPEDERNQMAKDKNHFSHYFIHEVPILTQSYRSQPWWQVDTDKPTALSMLDHHGLLYYFSDEIAGPQGLFMYTYNEYQWVKYRKIHGEDAEWDMVKYGYRPTTTREWTVEALLNQFENHIYLPPLYQTGDGGREMSFSLTFTKAEDPTDTRTYRLRLANKDTDTDCYAIRRNTIYRYDLTFYGASLEYQSGVKVLPWKRVDQTIEVDPDGPGFQDNNIVTKP